MPNKHAVIEAHAAHPEWTAQQIAEATGGCVGWVNATAHRNGLRVAKVKRFRTVRPKTDNLYALGRAARVAGLTVADITSLWACTGCGTRKSMEQIRTEHPDAIACCPQRKMAPALPSTLPKSPT